jgi:hypothetical protein
MARFAIHPERALLPSTANRSDVGQSYIHLFGVMGMLRKIQAPSHRLRLGNCGPLIGDLRASTALDQTALIDPERHMALTDKSPLGGVCFWSSRQDKEHKQGGG